MYYLDAVVEDPILKGYYNSMLIGINSPKVVEDPILRGYHNIKERKTHTNRCMKMVSQ